MLDSNEVWTYYETMGKTNSKAHENNDPLIGKGRDNLDDFDQLWDVEKSEAEEPVESSVETLNPPQVKIANPNKKTNSSKEKDFEIQKLSWQLGERQKELSLLYTKVNEIMDMNRKLNDQLNDFLALEKEHKGLKDFTKTLSDRYSDCQKELNELKAEMSDLRASNVKEFSVNTVLDHALSDRA